MERKSFELTVYVLDKDKKVIRLNKEESLEVKWKGGGGRASKEVFFKKNGKDYRILVVVILEKYLLGMRDVLVRSKFSSPTTADYQVYEGYMGEPGNSPEEDKKRRDEGVRITNEWNRGRITIILLTIILAVFIFTLWMVKKRKREFPRTP